MSEEIPAHGRPKQVMQMYTLIYKKRRSLELCLDVYLPKEVCRLPVLLWFHSGGCVQGSRKEIAPHFLRGVERQEYIFVSADYRLAPQAGIKEIFDDVRDCVHFVRYDLIQHPEIGLSIDTSRLIVSGSSAGGYLALLAGLYCEPRPDAVVALYPISDPMHVFYTTSQAHPLGGGRVLKEAIAEYLDPEQSAIAFVEPGSPRAQLYFFVMQEALLGQFLRIHPNDTTFRIPKSIEGRAMSPVYIVHGDSDTSVPVNQSDELYGAMLKLDLSVKYERLQGLNHQFDLDTSFDMPAMHAYIARTFEAIKREKTEADT